MQSSENKFWCNNNWRLQKMGLQSNSDIKLTSWSMNLLARHGVFCQESTLVRQVGEYSTSRVDKIYLRFVRVVDWFRGLWSSSQNMLCLGLFEGQNKSTYFQKSLPQLCMWMKMTRKTLEVKILWILMYKSSCFQIFHFLRMWSTPRLAVMWAVWEQPLTHTKFSVMICSNI